MKITVTGANGLLGKNLLHRLQLDGHDVYALVRNPQKVTEIDSKKVFSWGTPLEKVLAGMDAVIHLAGEGIADKPWTKKRKSELAQSRILSTVQLVQAFEKISIAQRPQVFISASAIGFYGNSENEIFTEDSKMGEGFLADLCAQWEQESQKVVPLGLRHVNIRLGLVLSKEGGFLSKMGPFILGDGKQWMSWIHIDDVLGAISALLKDGSATGPINLVSPEPITGEELTKIFSKKMGFPFTVKVPTFLLKIVLGELSSAVLASQKVQPQKLKNLNYTFLFSNFAKALDHLYQEISFLDNTLIVTQFIAESREKIFAFFSAAENLEAITPPWLNFHVTKKSADKMRKDILIDYRLKIRGVPAKWQTLISDWTPEKRFIDEQLKGPYKKWHHVHLFEDVPGGTLIRDEVTFRVPGHIFGKLLLTPLIRKDVEMIFNFRKKKIQELFKS